MMFACAPKDSAVIDLTVPGGGEKEVVLSKLQVNRIVVEDTLKLDASGSAKCKVNVTPASPEFYYLSYNRKRIASLILKGGDKVAVSVDTLGKNLSISGSDESVRLAGIEKKIYTFTAKFDSLSVELVNANERGDSKGYEELGKELGRHFIMYKRAAVSDIMSAPYSFSNVSLLYQKLSDNLPLFGDMYDIAYFKRVYDSLSVIYPESVYVTSLKEDIAKFEKTISLSHKLNEAGETAYPELSLPDTKGEVQKLSSLLGKPFILVFWSSQLADQKMFNHDLKEVYKKFNPKGLEIYQVSADIDKTLWATVVKEQELPWINVCDGLGAQSAALNTYGVTTIPMMFVFDKEGNIVAKNLFDKGVLERSLNKLF